jgi:DMSO reductase family type II enzyme heme b subunit
MTILLRRGRWWLAAATLTLVAATGVLLRAWSAGDGGSGPAAPADLAAPAKPRGQALPPAANLRIPFDESQEKPEELLSPASRAWDRAKETAILLNRTPRIYQTESVANRPVPACRVCALRGKDRLYLRLQWDDPTKSAPEAPPARTNEAKHLPRRPTGHTSAFADAAAVMIPKQWAGPSFPALLMGDRSNPVYLYYWNASRGAEVLTGSGRTTPQPTGKSFSHQAHHDTVRWVLTLALPAPPDGYPMAFAVWDGQAGDRDGLKFFSVWYVLTRG